MWFEERLYVLFPGKPIIENISDAIYGSRKTICVISHHYLESEWCSREIQMARWGRHLFGISLQHSVH